MTVSTLFELWTAVAVSLGTIFAWLSWRVMRNQFLLNVPHVEASRNSAHHPEQVFFGLTGVGSDQWEIVEVRLKSPGHGLALHETIMEPDKYGGFKWLKGKASGTRLSQPKSPLFLSSNPTKPIVLVFTLASKVSHTMRGKRIIRVS